MSNGQYLDKIFKKSESIATRIVSDKLIIVPIRDDVHNLESIYTLDGIGPRIWELIDGKKKNSEIRDILLGEFEVEPAQLEEDLLTIIKQMEAREVVEPV